MGSDCAVGWRTSQIANLVLIVIGRCPVVHIHGGNNESSAMSLDWNSWSTVSEAVVPPGSPITVVPYPGGVGSPAHRGHVALFITDSNGVVRANWSPVDDLGRPFNWGRWDSVADGRAPPGSPVTVVEWGAWPFAVFVTGEDGVIYNTAGSPNGYPGGWAAVANGRAPPGSPVTAAGVAGHADYFVFCTRPITGAISMVRGNPEQDYGPVAGYPDWVDLREISLPPGSSITATKPNELGFPVPINPSGSVDIGHILYVTDVNGGVYTTADGGGWSSVFRAQRTAAPGSPVALLHRYDALFVTAPDGLVIFTTLRSSPLPEPSCSSSKPLQSSLHFLDFPAAVTRLSGREFGIKSPAATNVKSAYSKLYLRRLFSCAILGSDWRWFSGLFPWQLPLRATSGKIAFGAAHLQPAASRP